MKYPIIAVVLFAVGSAAALPTEESPTLEEAAKANKSIFEHPTYLGAEGAVKLGLGICGAAAIAIGVGLLYTNLSDKNVDPVLNPPMEQLTRDLSLFCGTVCAAVATKLLLVSAYNSFKKCVRALSDTEKKLLRSWREKH